MFNILNTASWGMSSIIEYHQTSKKLEKLFDTFDVGIEDIGDLLLPFFFVGTAFVDYENPGFGEV
ncbi:hypothetical protein JS569_26955, partial [Klebsiella pneumoniae]